MANEKRLIEIPSDGIVRIPIMRGADTIGEKRIDLSYIPTVEAVEVVHSQWDTVFYERNGTLASYSHICPECKYFYRDLRFKGHNYCPNCGAKMDGGNEDD